LYLVNHAKDSTSRLSFCTQNFDDARRNDKQQHIHTIDICVAAFPTGGCSLTFQTLVVPGLRHPFISASHVTQQYDVILQRTLNFFPRGPAAGHRRHLRMQNHVQQSELVLNMGRP
jgi:hypothetical protein